MRSKNADKIVKDKDKSEKKAAKMEKDKKDKEAHSKSRSLMANFFNKTKTASMHPESTSRLSPLLVEASCAAAGSSKETAIVTSDYDKTFKPFVCKKDVTLASSNWFLHARAANTDIILIDVDVEPAADDTVIPVESDAAIQESDDHGNIQRVVLGEAIDQIYQNVWCRQ